MIAFEITQFRGSQGALQCKPAALAVLDICWQASLALDWSNALKKTHRLLKVARLNSDVPLNCEHLGPISQLRLLTMFDIENAFVVTLPPKAARSPCWSMKKLFKVKNPATTFWVGSLPSFHESWDFRCGRKLKLRAKLLKAWSS